MPPRPPVPPTVSRQLRTSPRPTSPRAASRRSVCTSFRPAFPRPTSHCQPQPASRHPVGRRSAEMWAALGGAGGLHVGLLLGGARGLHSSPVSCGKNLLKKFASKTKYTNLAKTHRRSVLLASMGTGPCPHPLPHTGPACVLPAPCCPLLSHCWDVRCTTFQPMWRLEGKGEVSGEWQGVRVRRCWGQHAAGQGWGQGRARIPSISWARTRRMAARISLRSSYSAAPRSCR